MELFTIASHYHVSRRKLIFEWNIRNGNITTVYFCIRNNLLRYFYLRRFANLQLKRTNHSNIVLTNQILNNGGVGAGV